METLGERLERARKKAGIESARKAADEMKKSGVGRPVAHSTIGKHEKDETKPKADMLLCYAATYGVNPAWLVTGSPPMRSMPGHDAGDVQRFTARQLRHLADHLERAADEGVDMLSAEVVSVEVFEDPRTEDGEDDDRDLGKPRSEAG